MRSVGWRQEIGVDAHRMAILKPWSLGIAANKQGLLSLQRLHWKSSEVLNLQEKIVPQVILLGVLVHKAGRMGSSPAIRKKCRAASVCACAANQADRQVAGTSKLSQIVFFYSSLCDRCVIPRFQAGNGHVVFSLERSRNKRKITVGGNACLQKWSSTDQHCFKCAPCTRSLHVTYEKLLEKQMPRPHSRLVKVESVRGHGSQEQALWVTLNVCQGLRSPVLEKVKRQGQMHCS